MTTYIFDGSFEGLLTAVFEFYDERKPELVWDKHYQPSMLAEALEVITMKPKQSGYGKDLKKKLSPEWRTIFIRPICPKIRRHFSTV